MMVKVFDFNKNKKIEFTKEELEKLLNEVYNAGYIEGKSYHWTWTSPTVYPSWYCTTSSNDGITITTASDNTIVDSSDFNRSTTVTINVPNTSDK